MIYLMRHGESVVNITRRLTCREYDGDLTDKGRDQASKAANSFVGKGLTEIRYSPFRRAQQTAEIIAATVDVMPIMNVDLAEMDCGHLEGRSDEAAWAIWAQVYERWCLFDLDSRFPGGESYGEAVARFKRALNQFPSDDNVLLVTHGGITRSVIPPLCVNASALQRVDHLDNTSMIVLEHYDSDRYSCSAWNLIEHLSN